MNRRPEIDGSNALLLPDDQPGPELVAQQMAQAPCPVVQRVASPVAQQAPTPMVLLQMAMDQGADLEKLQQLMDLQERWEAGEARKAFVLAMAKFKENPPQIVKDHKVSYDGVNYKHAELGQVADKVGRALAGVGISHRWKTEQVEGKIRVTCILTHSLGHSEETTLESAPDTSGKKNAIQSIGSAVSYLQRYTILAATGLATGEDDNDGRDFGMTEDTFQDHLKAIREAGTIAALQEVYIKAQREAKADKPTLAAIIKAKDIRKAELAQGAVK